MADDTQQTIDPDPVQNPEPTKNDDSKEDKPNPLDVLEKLLDEIDQGKDPKSLGAKNSSKSGEPAGPTPEEIAAKELEEQKIEYERIKAEQKVIDDQKIIEQRDALANEMKTGEANVARANQDNEKKSEKEKKYQDQDGYEVVQLDHTKI
jgi:hypothetical protein